GRERRHPAEETCRGARHRAAAGARQEQGGTRMSTTIRIPARSALRLACLVLAAIALSACTRGMGDLPQKVDEVKARKGPPIEPIPVMKTFETFEYTAQSLRDPFSPSAEDEGNNPQGPRPDMNRPREALELFPLDSLDMVGTLGMGSKDIAGLIKDPDGV